MININFKISYNFIIITILQITLLYDYHFTDKFLI